MNGKSILRWLKSTIIRAVKSMAQTALASIGTSSVVLSDFSWKFVLSTAGIAGIISLLMSLETFPESEIVAVAIKEPKPSAETSGKKQIAAKGLSDAELLSASGNATVEETQPKTGITAEETQPKSDITAEEIQTKSDITATK